MDPGGCALTWHVNTVFIPMPCLMIRLVILTSGESEEKIKGLIKCL